ncbi:hypothetical protein GYB22_10960 [bacterium]|nr:hypothetical protein [bacterium]
MPVNSKSTLAIIGLAAILINIASCTYPEGPSFSLKTKKSRLVGIWNTTDADGVQLNGARLLLEFKSDGTLHYIIRDKENTAEERNFGEWKWESDKEEIEIDINNTEFTLEIRRLTNKELFLEDPEDDLEWKLEKVKEI